MEPGAGHCGRQGAEFQVAAQRLRVRHCPLPQAAMAKRSSNLDQNPTLRGRRLAMELQRRREATGMSREEVARQLEWSTSTLFRIETGRSHPQPGHRATLPIVPQQHLSLIGDITFYR